MSKGSTFANPIVSSLRALDHYFYCDMTRCNDNDVLDVSAALDMYFHRDIQYDGAI